MDRPIKLYAKWEWSWESYANKRDKLLNYYLNSPWVQEDLVMFNLTRRYIGMEQW